MFVISKNKLDDYIEKQKKEFLYDLTYEIIRDYPALKLNDFFYETLKIIIEMIESYSKQGINRIHILKSLVISDIYLGKNYQQDICFSWLLEEMEFYDINDQHIYIDVFLEAISEYKECVIGNNFNHIINALKVRKLSARQNLFEKLEIIFPEKVNFLKKKNIFDGVVNTLSSNANDNDAIMKFTLGNGYKENIFFKNLLLQQELSNEQK